MSARRRPPRGIFPRFPLSEDVERELRAHLELRAGELERQGWEPAAARAEAERLFGDVGHVAEACERITRSHDRAARRGRMVGDIGHDIRYALRTLAKAPGFTAVALLTLGLGIGANTAIFSVVDGVLLTPLPYDEPHELVSVEERRRDGGTMSVAWANFRDWRAESRSFEALTAYGSGTTTVLGGGEPAWATVAFVSEDYWRVFGVRAAAGRLTAPRDHEEGAAPVVVVAAAFAREVLGTDDPVGRTVEAFGRRAEVVGVVPAGFDHPGDAQLWTPTGPQGESRSSHNWSVVGRLRDGVALEAAAQELDALTQRIVGTAGAGESPEYLAAGTVTEPLRTRVVGDTRRPLLILLGAAAFVLLVACTNLASTLLARGTARVPELALRSALGAGRGRLVRQFLTESLVLALGGGVTGLALAAGAIRVLRRVGESSVPRLDAVGIDGTVLGFTLATSVVTALAFGLLPALRATEGDQAGTLREGRGGGPARGRTWAALVATEVALALVLLVGSGLLVRSFVAVMTVDGGFDPDDVVATSVALSGVKYPELDDHALLWDDLLRRMASAPGVGAAGLITSPPVGGFAPNGRISLDGDPTKEADAIYVVASAGAFEALDIPLLQGRLFEAADGPGSVHVAVVSRSFAERYWPGEDPIGRQVSGGGMDDLWEANPPVYGTVVGVVGDVRYRDLTRAGAPTVYWHYKQRPYRIRFGATLVAEATGGDPVPLAPVLRATVRAADPDVAVPLKLMRDLVSDSVAQRRFVLLVLVGFGGIALVLAGVGIYGVVSYSVARRTREMGVRLALGAAPAQVRSLVLAGALRPIVAGLVVGTVAGLAASRVMASLLYEVSPTDAVTFAIVPAILLVAGIAASWLPARRGTSVDPIRAMRAD